MKEIKLTQGKVAQVDDDMFEFLNQWKWCAIKVKNTYYAVRGLCIGKRINNKTQTISIRMHRVIINTPKDLQVDHIDHNGLNNQKNNLRIATNRQNCINRKSCGKSIYIGVGFIGEKYIEAHICPNGKKKHLGYFDTEELAARARDIASVKYYGEFANLNFKPITIRS